MDSSTGTLELLGVVSSVMALFFSMATLLVSWLTLSTDLLPMESIELGLWGTCIFQEVGPVDCRPYDSMLELPSEIQLARILISLVMGLGLLSLALAIPGLNSVNGCRDQLEDLTCKRALKGLAGVLCLVSGILVLFPASYIAHLTVVRYFDELVPIVVPRWEFGYGLFCGWIAGIFHVIAGILLLTSCLNLHNLNRGVNIPLVLVTPESNTIRSRSAYV